MKNNSGSFLRSISEKVSPFRNTTDTPSSRESFSRKTDTDEKPVTNFLRQIDDSTKSLERFGLALENLSDKLTKDFKSDRRAPRKQESAESTSKSLLEKFPFLAAQATEKQKNTLREKEDKPRTVNRQPDLESAAGRALSGVTTGIGGSTGQVAGSALNTLRELKEALSPDELMGKLGGSFGPMGKMVTGMVTGIIGTVLGGIGAYESLILPAGNRLQQSTGKLSGINRGISRDNTDLEDGFTIMNNLGQDTRLNELLGLSKSELRSRMTDTARASGSASNLTKRTLDEVTAEKYFGTDEKAFAPLSRETFRFNPSEQDFGRNIAKVADILEKSKIINANDTSRLLPSVNQIARYNDVQAGRFNTPSFSRSVELTGAANRLGGVFQGEAGQSKLLGLDRAITNPDNIYKENFLLSALSRQNPRKSFRELRRQQQKGIFDGNGENFRAIYTEMEKRYGGRETETFKANFDAFLESYGLNIEAVDKLVQAGPNALRGVGSNSSRYSPEAMRKRAISNVPVLDKLEATTKSFLEMQGVEGVGGVKDIEKFLKTAGLGLEAADSYTRKDFAKSSQKFQEEQLDKQKVLSDRQNPEVVIKKLPAIDLSESTKQDLIRGLKLDPPPGTFGNENTTTRRGIKK